jgi:3-oxoacyl-[acyl-carrier protein] reductase
LARRSPSVWPPTGRQSRSPIRRERTRRASVVEAIKRSGGKAIALQAEATAADQVKAAIDKTVNSFGKLDVFVNNAGTAIPKKFEETTLDEFDRMIDINLRGAFVATQAALRHMNGGGRIILIGSCVGERMMTPGLVAYAVTKGAIKMFAQGLAREVGDRGITVNNIQPGPIDTDLNPASGDWAAPQKTNTALNRYGEVDDVAALTAFVAGSEAAYINGGRRGRGRRAKFTHVHGLFSPALRPLSRRGWGSSMCGARFLLCPPSRR